MIHNILGQKLRPIIRAEAALRRREALSVVLGIGAVIAGVLLLAAKFQDFWSWPMVIGTAVGVILAAMIALWIADSRKTNVKEIADRIEAENPDLQTALVTAVEQKPGPNGELGYLQEKVVLDAVNHALSNNWVKQISQKRLFKMGLVQLLMAAAFFITMFGLLSENNRLIELARAGEKEAIKVEEPVPDPLSDYEIEVNPGNAEVEKGSKLIVEAKFGERVPPGATVVILEPGEEEVERGRVPLKPGLDEQVFAGMITKIDSDAIYRIEFDDEKSDDFTIATFVHPKLEQADATITPPDYTEQKAKKVEDTRKISLMEGSDLAWSMKVNKPVQDAELFSVDSDSIITLKPSAEDPTLLIASHVPEFSAKYRLHLVDDRERANKRPPIFTINVKKNLPPKLDFEFPKRDVQVSAIQEMPVEGKVWDDVGVLKAGVTFAFGEETREIALADLKLDGGKNHPLKTLFAFEDIGAKPRDFVTYHLWAEDLGPDAKPRRTTSDMFFAEVREFEDIFREQESQGGEPGEPGEQGGAAAKLMKLQKEVINANWQIMRRYQMGRKVEELIPDIEVVRESQEIAISQLDAALEEVEDAEIKALFAEARIYMAKAVDELLVATSKPDGSKLEPAQNFEKLAYGALVKAKNREHNITRSEQSQSQGQPQEQEQQMMQLEMKQKNLRYEEQKLAEEAQPQTPEQKENLEVLNKLKELARRQEAIAKKIKELETALEEAETEEEKSELDRQLKRLQEEQEQLLRELDEVTEKMDSEQNRANMSEEREKLEETREAVKDAAKNLDEGNLADAANEATRAQREMEEVKEDFRKKTSRQFSEEMRELRGTARELAEAQEAIGKELDKTRDQNNPFEATPADNLALSRELDNQREKLDEMLNQMRELSEQSEESEPLLSDALYEGVREAIASGVENSLKDASQLTRYNRREAARDPERDAARGMEALQENVEKAAEKVLGSEADSLRLARSELDQLIEKSQAEAENLRGRGEENEPNGEPGEGDQLAMNDAQNGQRQGPGEPGQEGSEDGKGGADSPKGESPKSQAGQGKGKGEGEQPGKGESPGEKGSPKGDQPGEGKGEGEKGEQPGKGAGDGKGEGEGKGEMAENQKGQGGKGQQPGEGKAPGKGGEKGKGKGQGKGKGEGQGAGKGESQQLAENGQPQQGQGKGEGQGKGSEKGEGQGKGKGSGKGEGQGQGKGQGQPKGYRQGLADSSSPRQGGGHPSGAGSNRGGGGGPNWGGGDDKRNGPPSGGSAQAGKPMFFNRQEEEVSEDPITGEGYEEWANRLGNIEEMLEQDDLRNEVAKVLDDARAMRIDFRRDNAPPQANAIETRITNPLVELRNQLTEELAKLDKENPLAPIDRDPVPGEFRELVKKYYEELGSGK